VRPARNAIPYDDIAEIVAANPTSYAAVVADDYDVPIATAHRWAREARRRGLLSADLRRPCRACGGTGFTAYRGGDALSDDGPVN
jgi:hypothetical protein